MRLRPALIITFSLLAAAALTFQIFQSYFAAQEIAKARGRLSLYQSTVESELARFSHLTYVLAHDQVVINAVQGGTLATLDRRLESFAQRAGLEAIYLISPTGETIAASNHRDRGSFVGQNYAFRPYFQDAMAGRQGRFYAIGTTTHRPGYFIADPVADAQDEIAGVIAIKIDLSALAARWRKAGERVFLVNEDGVVLLASNPGWQYRAMGPILPDRLRQITAARQFPGQDLRALAWHPQPGDRAEVDGETGFHLAATVPPHGWTLHYLADQDPVITRSWLATLILAMGAVAAIIALQIQRARRLDADLALSAETEAELRQANARLISEIRERTRIERNLRRTQSELESASRLAALGRLAASVTHELGQPITAMRNHLATAGFSAHARDALPAKIESLVDRMESITRELKFFASRDAEDFTEIDLRAAIEAALDLLAPNIERAGADVHRDLPDARLPVWGVQLRIEQVLTNLFRNALDASEDATPPRLTIRAGSTDGAAWVEVEDNGHGLGAASLDELQKPFMTTRGSGRGMGLGLAISDSIVKDHGGTMSARDLKHGGALFRVSFPPVSQKG